MLRLLVVFIGCLISQYSLSHVALQTSTPKFKKLETQANKLVGRYSEFERINEQQGQVEVGYNIANLTSGGASFGLSVKELRGMAPLPYLQNWIVDLPFIEVSASAVGNLESADICRTPIPASHSSFKHTSAGTRTNFSASYYADPYNGGDQPKVNIPGVYSGYLRKAGSVANGFPAGVEYGLNDYSTVKCIQTPKTGGRWSGFLLTRPNGNKYTFDNIDFASGDIWGGSQASIYRIFISKIEDARGNSIDFEYNRYDPVPSISVKEAYKASTHVYPKRITTSKGQEVLFNYGTWPSDSLPKLVSIEEDRGGAETAKYKFAYKFDKAWSKSNYCHFLGSRVSSNVSTWCGKQEGQYSHNYMLETLELPDGRKATFEYHGPIASNIFNGSRYFMTYPGISGLSTSDGLNIQYEYIALEQSALDSNALTDNDFKVKTAHISKRTQKLGGAETIYTYEYHSREADYHITIVTPFKEVKRGYNRNAPLKGKIDVEFSKYSGDPGRGKITTYSYRSINLLPKISNVFRHDDGRYSTVLAGVNDGIFKTSSGKYNKYNMPTEMYYYDKYKNLKKEIYTYVDSKPGVEARWISKIKTKTVQDHSNSGPEINILNNDYNDYGEVVSSIENGIESTYIYENNGDLKSRSWMQDGQYLSESYNDYIRERPQKVIRSDGSILEKSIDQVSGALLWSSDLLGLKTEYEYNNAGKIRSINYPAEYEFNDVSISYYINHEGQRVERINEGNYSQINTYDAYGNKKKYDQTGGDITVPTIYTNYNSQGLLVSKTQGGLGKYERDEYYSYDPDLRLLRIDSTSRFSSKRSKGKSICYDFCEERDIIDYIKIGNIFGSLELSFPVYGWVDFDASGDLDDPLCLGLPCSNTNIGRIIRDADNSTSIYIENQYGVYGERFTVEEKHYLADGKLSKINYKYDILGNLTSAISNGIEKKYEYDLSKGGKNTLLKSQTTPEAGKYTYTYYENGLLQNVFHNDVQLSSLKYDSLGRLKLADYKDLLTKDISFNYTSNDLIDYSLSGSTKIDYEYYPSKKLKKHTLIEKDDSNDNKAFSLSYEYAGKHLSKITYPSGREVSLLPDVLGRPKAVGKYVSDLTYYGDSNAVSDMTYANGITHSMVLNTDYQPEIYSYKSLNSDLLNEFYSYYPDDVIKSIKDNVNGVNNISLEYDRHNRMTVAKGRWGYWTYTYDQLDNIASINTSGINRAYSYTPGNLLVSAMGKEFSYDGRGNITSNGKNNFSFNLMNQLVGVPNKGISYEYDANGNRSRTKNILNNSTNFELYDNNGDLFYEYDSLTGTSTDYIYAQKTLVARVEASDQDNDGDGIVDFMEEKYGLDKNTPDANDDLDGDGLTNIDEINRGLLPNDSDSDNDQIPDGVEVSLGLNPSLNDAAIDTDSDGLTNYEEFIARTDPFNPDTDNDGMLDGVDELPLVNFAVLTIITNSILLH